MSDDQHFPAKSDKVAMSPSPSTPKEESKLLAADSNGSSAYPRSVFFIISNEFCERFSFHGMRAILILYLTQWLKFSNNTATAIYHAFVVICYFSPLFGALLADGYLGKFKTIFYVSLVYASGSIVMTFTAFPPPEWIGPIIGLVLIGIGTGGIKPCVSAFGGDQFAADQEKQRNQFFSIFYFVINLGSLLSIFVTPVVREYVHCFGSSCFPVAFGIPAILMLLAVVLFVVGRRYYKIVPATGSVIRMMACCICRALKNKWHSTEKKEYWLYHADDKYEIAFLNDVKCVLHVFWLFIPIPVFWALFDQQGSRWTLQSAQLDLHVVGGWYLLPDQVQAVNSILILVFIPLFEFGLYPLFELCGLLKRPLQRMVVGMMCAALAFVIAGFLEIKIEKSLNGVYMAEGNSKLSVINMTPCPVSVGSPFSNASLQYTQSTPVETLPSGNSAVFMTTTPCLSYSNPVSSLSTDVNLDSQQAYYLITAMQGSVPVTQQAPEEVLVTVFMFDFLIIGWPHLFAYVFFSSIMYPIRKSNSGGSLVGLLYISNVVNGEDYALAVLTTASKTYTFALSNMNVSSFVEVQPAVYDVSVITAGNKKALERYQLTVGSGAVSTLIISANDTEVDFFNYETVHVNAVSFWYQMPQYILITFAEVLFSITGLAFAYSQAPDSMKSVVTAGWLLTTAFGDLIVVLVAGVRLFSQVFEFFFFAILMTVTLAVFSVMAYFYQYVEHPPAENKRMSYSDDVNLTKAAEAMATEPASGHTKDM